MYFHPCKSSKFSILPCLMFNLFPHNFSPSISTFLIQVHPTCYFFRYVFPIYSSYNTSPKFSRNIHLWFSKAMPKNSTHPFRKIYNNVPACEIIKSWVLKHLHEHSQYCDYKKSDIDVYLIH